MKKIAFIISLLISINLIAQDPINFYSGKIYDPAGFITKYHNFPCFEGTQENIKRALY